MRPPRPLPRAERAAQQPPTVAPTEPSLPRDPNAVPEGWDGIMAPGEQILWRGRPVRRIAWARVAVRAGVGAVFAVGGFRLAAEAMQSHPVAGFVGLPAMLFGIGLIAVTLLNERMRLNDTFYTLSDRAAYIARRHWRKGRTLDTVPITAEMPLTIRGGDKVGDVVFGTRQLGSDTRPRREEIGFFAIAFAPEVFAILKHAQEARR